MSLTFNSRWVVHVGGRRVPDTCDVLKSLPFSDEQRVLEFMKAIDEALCMYWQSRGVCITTACSGKGWNHKGRLKEWEKLLLSLMVIPVVDGKGKEFNHTV